MVEPPCMLQNAPQRGFHLQPRHVNLSHATFALKDDGPCGPLGGRSVVPKLNKYSDKPSQTVEQANKCLKEPPTILFNPNFEICTDKFLGNHHNIYLLLTPAPKFSVVNGPRSKPPQVRGFQDVGGSVELMDSCWLRW